MPTYVYIVEQGEYSNRGIVGVYASAAAAMAAHPIPLNVAHSARDRDRDGGWQPVPQAEPDTYWDNGYEWDHGKEIHRYEVEDASPPSIDAVGQRRA